MKLSPPPLSRSRYDGLADVATVVLGLSPDEKTRRRLGRARAALGELDEAPEREARRRDEPLRRVP